MIYININNWRKPIFRFIKPKNKQIIKSSNKLLEDNKEPAIKIVYEIVNNELISKIETRTVNSSNEYSNYIANKLGNHINCSYLYE